VARGTKQNRPVSTGMQYSAMSQEQVAALAKKNWKRTPKLHREFRSETAYVAFCKAEAAGRVRFLDKLKAKQAGPSEQKRDRLRDILESMWMGPGTPPAFLAMASSAADTALREISKAGFPSKLQELQADKRLKAPPHIFDAYRLLDAREELALTLEPLVSSPNRREILHIVSVAVEIGWLVHRLKSWQDFPYIVSGRRASRGGKKGSETTHSPEKREEREREWGKWRAEYARLEKADPGRSRTSIADEMGRTFGVSGRNIRRHVPR
jgi:hypothetical protein